MASPMDIDTLRDIIRAMLTQHSGPLDAAEVEWIAFALGHICTNYTMDEFSSIITRTALEQGERPLQGLRLDS